MSVSPSLWLDAAPASSRRAALQASARQAASGTPSWVLGTVLATSADDTTLPAGWARVAIPADAPVSEAAGMTDGGLSAVGATVRVTLDATGRVTGISSPIMLPDGADTVATGALGERISTAMTQAAEAYSQAAAIREAAQQAAASAEQAMSDAAAALRAAEGATGAIVSAAEPENPVEGQIWYQLDGDSGQTIVGVKVRVGDEWVARPLVAEQVLVPGSVGTVALQDGAITAPKIYASEELWAKIAAFGSVTTDMLTAGNATISGTAVVGDLVGNTLTGGSLIAGDESTGTARITTNTSGPYIQFKNSADEETFFVDSAGNFRMIDRVRGGTVSLDNYLASWTYNNTLKDSSTVNTWTRPARTSIGSWMNFLGTQYRVMTPTGKLRFEHRLVYNESTLAADIYIQLGLYAATPTTSNITSGLYNSIAYAEFHAMTGVNTPSFTASEVITVPANTWYYVRAIWRYQAATSGALTNVRYWSQTTPV